jgi:hypothetical protein
VDAKMQLGTVAETVMVTGEAALLQTDSATVGSLINEKTVQDAPIPGRNIIAMVQMVPGASEGALSSLANGTRPDERRQTSSVSINGVNDVLNNQLVDGMDNNERTIGTVGIKPSIDAIAEVKVQTNMYTAETGRTLGGVINILTKSGSNQFHGSAFEFIRNEVFDSPLYFATDKPITRQNQWGGSLGGPIKSNRAFFFADYEGYRLQQGVPTVITVPTLKMRTGDFSELPVQIFDPTTNPRVAFPGNIIPADRIDSIAKSYMALYPLPTSPGLGNNYAATNLRKQDNDATDMRVDFRFNNSNNVFARYSFNRTYTLTPSLCPVVTVGSKRVDPTCIVGGAATGAYSGPNNTTAHNVVGSWVHVFNSQMLSELKGNFTKPDMLSTGQNPNTFLGDFYGIPNANDPTKVGENSLASGLPLMEMRPTTIGAIGETQWVPLQIYNRTYQVAGSITKASGSHNLKVGSAIIIRRFGVLQSNTAQGMWGFDATTTNGGAGNAVGGYAVAGFLLGYPTDVRRLYTPYAPLYHSNEPSVYVQDDWRTTSWLTLNLGMRYDIFGPLSEAENRLSNWDPTSRKLLVAGVDGVSKTGGVKTDYSDWGPRLGFSATLPNKMVLRGGFGLAYYPNNKNAGAFMKNPPFTANYGPITSATASNGLPNMFLKDGLPVVTFANPLQPIGNVIGTDLNYKSDRAKQFNVMVEKEFSGNVVTVGYIGARGDRLQQGKNYNLAPAAPGTIQSRRPYFSQYPDIANATVLANVASSTYNAWQFIFNRRYKDGLTFTTHYTWAHAMETRLTPWDFSLYETGDTPNFDVTHHYVLTSTYELPWGKDLKGVAHGILADWQLNGAAFFQSGVAFTIVNASSRTNTGGADRPIVTGDPELHGSDQTIQHWFNTAAFSAAPPNTPGNVGYAIMHGPGQRRIDISIFKDFKMGGTKKMQFRWEVYNLANWANFYLPDFNFGSTVFGQISSTGNSIPRQMQIGLKFLF